MYINFRNASLGDVRHLNKLINHTQLIKRTEQHRASENPRQPISMHEYRHRHAHMSNRSYRSPKGHRLSGWHHRGHQKGQGPEFGVKRCRWTGLPRHCSAHSVEAIAMAVVHPANALLKYSFLCFACVNLMLSCYSTFPFLFNLFSWWVYVFYSLSFSFLSFFNAAFSFLSTSFHVEFPQFSSFHFVVPFYVAYTCWLSL